MVTIANDSSIGQVMNLLKESKAWVLDRGATMSRDVEIPVLYNGMQGPDMRRVCEKTGLSTAEVIRRHSEPDYLVHFIGFSIGFPYLGGMDASISTVPSGNTPEICSCRVYWDCGESDWYLPKVLSGRLEYYRSDTPVYI
jgi:allophanate hydrolase subunit 1